MKIECKIIEIMEDEISGSKNQILITNISIIKKQGYINLSEKYTFVFSKYSNLAREISSHPTNNLYIDLNQYTLRKINFQNVQNDFAYFHKSLLENINLSKSKQEVEKNNIADSLNECLFSCHLEMFIYYIYYIVASREFKNSNYIDNRKEILRRYYDVISVILKINFNVQSDSYKKLQENEIEEIVEKYGDAISYAEDFEKSISYFVMSNPNALEISNNIYNDEKCFYFNYIQNTVKKAFEICEKRFYLYKNSTDFFAHEFSFSNERVELKIFPTPYSFVESEEVDESFRKRELEEKLISYLENNNILKINNDDVTDKLKTKWLFKTNGIIPLFYVDRRNLLGFCEFGQQNRSQIFDCLFGNGQVNLSISEEINVQSA